MVVIQYSDEVIPGTGRWADYDSKNYDDSSQPVEYDYYDMLNGEEQFCDY